MVMYGESIGELDLVQLNFVRNFSAAYIYGKKIYLKGIRSTGSNTAFRNKHSPSRL